MQLNSEVILHIVYIATKFRAVAFFDLNGESYVQSLKVGSRYFIKHG